jgi:hypothetical protein
VDYPFIFVNQIVEELVCLGGILVFTGEL